MKKTAFIWLLTCGFSILGCQKKVDFTGYWKATFFSKTNSSGMSVLNYYISQECHYGSFYLNQTANNIYEFVPCTYTDADGFKKVAGFSM